MCSEIFQSNQKFCRQSGDSPDCPRTFQRVPKHSIVSGNFPACLESSPEYSSFRKKTKLLIHFYVPMQKRSIKQCLNAWQFFVTLRITAGPAIHCNALKETRERPDHFWSHLQEVIKVRKCSDGNFLMFDNKDLSHIFSYHSYHWFIKLVLMECQSRMTMIIASDPRCPCDLVSGLIS